MVKILREADRSPVARAERQGGAVVLQSEVAAQLNGRPDECGALAVPSADGQGA
jgi:hypothetical protein